MISVPIHRSQPAGGSRRSYERARLSGVLPMDSPAPNCLAQTTPRTRAHLPRYIIYPQAASAMCLDPGVSSASTTEADALKRGSIAVSGVRGREFSPSPSAILSYQAISTVIWQGMPRMRSKRAARRNLRGGTTSMRRSPNCTVRVVLSTRRQMHSRKLYPVTRHAGARRSFFLVSWQRVPGWSRRE